MCKYNFSRKNMDKFSIFCIVILTIGWTLSPYIKKKSIGKLSNLQYQLTNGILYAICISLALLVSCYYTNEKFENFYEIQGCQMLWLFLGAFVTAITTIMLMYLLTNNDVSCIIPQIQPIVIVFTVLLGYYFFKETLTSEQIIGCALIVLGVTIINFTTK